VLFGLDNPRRLALADEAEAMARELDDKATLAWVLARTGYAAVVPSRWEQWLARQEEGVQLADATGDPALRVFSRTLYAGALLLAGRVLEALEINDEMVAIADAECAPTERWLAHVSSLPNTLARRGVVASAARNDECLAMGQDAGITDALQWWAAAGSGPLWLMADATVIADAAGVFAAQFPNHKIWYAGWALMLTEAGRRDEALAVIDTYGLREDTLEDRSLPLVGTAQLAVICFELDDVQLAELVAPVLEKYVGLWGHYFLYAVGPVAWSLGCALSVLGEYDRAIGLLEQALDDLLEVGFRDHAAHCRSGLARIVRRRNGPGDIERARSLLDEARAHAETIPAPKLVERIDQLLAST
jgi:tetratricopeptide (TPR) repeat protein